MPLRVHQHDAALIEQAPVALDDDAKALAFLEREQSATVCQDAGVLSGGRSVLAHAAAMEEHDVTREPARLTDLLF
jgi:hypothetical protein